MGRSGSSIRSLSNIEALDKVFNEERRLVLIENGIQSIEKLLREERTQTMREIEEKKAILEKLKSANHETIEAVKKMNEETLRS